MNQQRSSNRSSAIMLFMLIAAILAGCAAPSVGAFSDKPRLVPSPDNPAQVSQLVQGNTGLAFGLYRQLYDGEENLIFAPYSLSVGLAMAYAGARGETETQMAQALHFDLPQSQLHPALNTLDQALTGREGDQLSLANALWGSQGSTYLDPFLDTLAQHYGAGVRLVDFGDSDRARQTINRWVSDETGKRIQELLPAGAVDGETDLVLTNATAFEADWASEFDPEHTQEALFTLLNGDQVPVSLMRETLHVSYAQAGGVSAVEIPYQGGAFSMVVLLPDANAFEGTVASLTAETLDTILDSMAPTYVEVSLPRFELDSAVRVKEILMALGMVDAFGAADFSGINGTRELFIDEVYHQAWINVDESGTEAAAGSAGVMVFKGEPAAEVVFTADHPFIFLIRDTANGTVVFLGHLLNPDL